MPSPYDAQRTIQERFDKYHADNPHVYERLLDLAYDAKLRGFNKISVDFLCHVLRWQEGIKTTGDRGFKINDHFTALYARLLIEHNPDLDGLFNLRKRVAP